MPSNRYAQRLTAHAADGVVGVDCGKHEHALVVRPREQPDAKAFRIATDRAGFATAVATITRLMPWSSPHRILIGLEFAGVYGMTFADFLADAGFRVVSVLPSHTKRYKEIQHGLPIKSDEHDARSIASLVADGCYSAYPFHAQCYADLRALTSRWETLDAERSQVGNRLIAALDLVFPECLRIAGGVRHPGVRAALALCPGTVDWLAMDADHRSRARFDAAVRRATRNHWSGEKTDRLIRAARSSLGLRRAQGAIRAEVPMLVARYDLVVAQQRMTRNSAARTLAGVAEASALMSIPTVSTMTAAAFFGHIGDVRAYRSSREIVRLAGLTLAEKSSGATKGPPRVTKRGRKGLRRIVHMLVIRLLDPTHAKSERWRIRYLALRERNGGIHHKAVVALMRELLRLLYAVARDRRPFDPQRSFGELAVR